MLTSLRPLPFLGRPENSESRTRSQNERQSLDAWSANTRRPFSSQRTLVIVNGCKCHSVKLSWIFYKTIEPPLPVATIYAFRPIIIGLLPASMHEVYAHV